MRTHKNTISLLYASPVVVSLIDSVPQVVQVACHHGDAHTNKPTKRDGRVEPLIPSLHNADKNLLSTFYFQIYFFKYKVGLCS